MAIFLTRRRIPSPSTHTAGGGFRCSRIHTDRRCLCVLRISKLCSSGSEMPTCPADLKLCSSGSELSDPYVQDLLLIRLSIEQ